MFKQMQEDGSIRFILFCLFLAILAELLVPYHNLAMWFGFAIAGYSVIANDSIQTLGTFLSSTRDLPWWFLWVLTAGILVITMALSWSFHGGDLSFGRLAEIPEPLNFDSLELMAPIVLIMLTRFRFPVSTTFLVLSIFSSQVVIQEILIKSALGYVVAFVFAFLVWWWMRKIVTFENNPNYSFKKWRFLQLFATGFLWVTWMMHDIANVVVFLPRQVSLENMLIVLGYLVLILGFIMYHRGGRIQKIVKEKANTHDLRVATIIDFCYAIVLIVFKELNQIPMSTTWVFLGILGGRELALSFFANQYEYGKTHALKLIRNDIIRAATGLLISLIIILFVVEF